MRLEGGLAKSGPSSFETDAQREEGIFLRMRARGWRARARSVPRFLSRKGHNRLLGCRLGDERSIVVDKGCLDADEPF